MKSKLISPAALMRGWQSKTSALLMLVATTGLVVGATTLERHERQNEATRAQVLEHAQIITHDCFLLRQLAPGEGESVRATINAELREEITTMRALSQSDLDNRIFSETLCACVLRDLHKNPGRYLSSTPDTRHAERAAWNALEASGNKIFAASPIISQK